MAKKKTKYDVIFRNDMYSGLETAIIEGKKYYSAESFLRKLLDLEDRNYQLIIETFVLNCMVNELNLTDQSFWDNDENKSFFAIVIKNINQYFTGYTKTQIICSILKSKITDKEKNDLLSEMKKSFPTEAFDQLVKNPNVDSWIRRRLLGNWQTDQDQLIEIVLSEEDKSVLTSALKQINVEEVNSPRVIELLILEEELTNAKRISLIEKCNNLEILNQLLMTSENMEIIRATRTRINTMPQVHAIFSDIDETEDRIQEAV